MKCSEHGTDGCSRCKPAMRAAWTAGQLKAVLAVIADDTPLVVNAVDAQDSDFIDEQVIVGAGFGTVDWGDGHGPESDVLFGLNCEVPEDLLRSRSARNTSESGRPQERRPGGEARRAVGPRSAEPEFVIETTTVDGRAYALLCCRSCSRYGTNVSRRVGGRIGDLFRTSDVAALLTAASRHECPAEVRAWAGQ